MFSESRFDAGSADTIIGAAMSANVSALHVGVDSSVRTEEFKTRYNCTQVNEGDDSQWAIGNSNIIIRWN